jgi:hypothetical protein
MLNIKQLQRLSSFNLTEVVKDAGLKLSNIRAKIAFGRELKVNESQALEKAIEKFGIEMKKEVENEIDVK